ncbi:hypothetical protein PG985_003224 [Apiospora marii]|uniref:uncharacterized protein n=1 Tax=Apiospora marii TaxID=335849 RepID=UPI00312F6AFE
MPPSETGPHRTEVLGLEKRQPWKDHWEALAASEPNLSGTSHGFERGEPVIMDGSVHKPGVTGPDGVKEAGDAEEGGAEETGDAKDAGDNGDAGDAKESDAKEGDVKEGDAKQGDAEGSDAEEGDAKEAGEPANSGDPAMLDDPSEEQGVKTEADGNGNDENDEEKK